MNKYANHAIAPCVAKHFLHTPMYSYVFFGVIAET